MEAVFTAIADPTRRILLGRLRDRNGLSLSELAEGLPISRQAVTKHLDALCRAGLVRVRHAGRERLHDLDARPLEGIDDWLRPYAKAWDHRLAALRSHLEEDQP